MREGRESNFIGTDGGRAEGGRWPAMGEGERGDSINLALAIRLRRKAGVADGHGRMGREGRGGAEEVGAAVSGGGWEEGTTSTVGPTVGPGREEGETGRPNEGSPSAG